MNIPWPTNIPAPQRESLSLNFGTNALLRRNNSGRVEARRFGAGAEDTASCIIRCRGDEIARFQYFYEVTLNLGLNWFTAPWVTGLGYPGYGARITGYPQKSASNDGHMDFSVNIQFRLLADCWPETSWPVTIELD